MRLGTSLRGGGSRPTDAPRRARCGCVTYESARGPARHPQLVGNTGLRALRAAIADPERFACDPKIDGVRGLVVYGPSGIETRDRRGERRDWLRADKFERGLGRLANRLPILWEGTVVDGADRWAVRNNDGGALRSKRHRPELRFVAFDVPVLAGVDLRGLPSA
jgi:ATP-dependent DNA ligase